MKKKGLNTVLKVVITLVIIFIIMCLFTGLKGGPMRFIESIVFVLFFGGAIFFVFNSGAIFSVFNIIIGVKRTSRNVLKNIDKWSLKSELKDEIIDFVSQHPDYTLVSVHYKSPSRIKLRTENSYYFFDIDETRFAKPSSIQPYESIFKEIAKQFDGKFNKKSEEIREVYTLTEIWVESRESSNKRYIEKERREKEYQKKVWY